MRVEKASAARRAGHREAARTIAPLRKPALSAWASSLLVRRRPDRTAAFLEFGQALRQAHGELDAQRMRELSGQQRRVITALSCQATRLAADAGHRVHQQQPAQREAKRAYDRAQADLRGTRRNVERLSGPAP